MKNQKYDLNVKGAFLHMAMDTLVSVGVVISGIIISVPRTCNPVVNLLQALQTIEKTPTFAA